MSAVLEWNCEAEAITTQAVAITSVIRVTGSPIRRKYMKSIGLPARSARPAAATLAAAAMTVMLPPKSAPNASAHQ